MYGRQILLFLLFLTAITNIQCYRLNGIQYTRKNECPSQEDIPKCHCNVESEALSITCKNFQTDSEFQDSLKVLREYSLKKLEISNYNASSVSTDAWEGQEIQHLSFSHIEVNDASFGEGKRYFQGLENSLRTLEVKDSFRNGDIPLRNLQLDHLKELNHAIFDHSGIPEVGNDWFTAGPESLLYLVFKRNGIKKLGDKVFASLSNLDVLAVNDNELDTISRSMLPNSATRLKYLDLAYNKIKNLPNDIFSDMPALQTLLLEGNLIHTIEEDTFGQIASQITTLNLHRNDLQCDEKMKWICDTKLKTAIGKCSSPSDKKDLTIEKFCE